MKRLDLISIGQQAVAILLTLLHLGIRNIRPHPTLPTFVSQSALKIHALTPTHGRG